MKLHEHETIWSRGLAGLKRTKVPGGWIYVEWGGLTKEGNSGVAKAIAMTSVFVPDPEDALATKLLEDARRAHEAVRSESGPF